ncbi:hypothetical protein A6A04_14345 [Paramagnetospirillum marisnigri]|uniref:Protein NosL n=1 Tax=Paramagnetospirillum marisnigri TaxID=1285242 RepID=A0A178MU82_9PROT|nr:hypothetical protein [Paramagnetospirillum marisnigri]OAN53135.1 hypothetical protein A6A04_14345 [Paramagnetospirillum marisnigri]
MCNHHMTRRHFVALVPGLALVASGCGGPSTGPVDVRLGRDVCDYCGMVIDDRRFVAQLRAGPSGKVHNFDDPGDAILFLVKQDWAKHPKTEFWVGHMETGQWLDGFKAFYVKGVKTPMAHGFGARPESKGDDFGFERFRGAILTQGSTSRCEPTVTTEDRG